MNQFYIPPLNFGMVMTRIYRSGLADPINLPFLETLQLRTVILLTPDDPPVKLQSWLTDQQITLVHLQVQSNAWDTITEDIVLQALKVLREENEPVLIMCREGRHRTGTVVGCWRKLQKWSLTAIFEEYRRFAGPKVRVLSEQFIELFDVELVA